MAAEIKQATGISPKLIEGSRGIFDIRCDDELIYSKFETGRFPRPGEIAKRLKEPKTG